MISLFFHHYCGFPLAAACQPGVCEQAIFSPPFLEPSPNWGRQCISEKSCLVIGAAALQCCRSSAGARPSHPDHLCVEITLRLPVHQTCRYAFTPSPQVLSTSHLAWAIVGASSLPSPARTLSFGSKSTEARKDQDSLYTSSQPHPMAEVDLDQVLQHPLSTASALRCWLIR